MSLRPYAGVVRRGVAVRREPPAAEKGPPAVRDLRGGAGDGPRRLEFAPGDVVVVSGLPGSGKSTLIRRAVTARAIDSQDTRDRFTAALPRLLPYALYRPLVRAAHYYGLLRALRSGEAVVVHDCGTQAWVRRWLARHAVRRGRTLHLVLLDVPPEAARAGQRQRGRGVSGYAFARHRRAVGRLLRDTECGRLPPGCASAVLLDRPAAGALRSIAFPGLPVGGAPSTAVPVPGRRRPSAVTVSAAGHGRVEDTEPVDIPAQMPPQQLQGWPANELEEVLSASLGVPEAAGRLVEVLGRSQVWIPLPNGGSPASADLDLPTVEFDGAAFVPVFSSEAQFLSCVGTHLSFAVAPAREFARGLPPQLGIAVNPGGAVGLPLPPAAVAELCRTGSTPLDGPAGGGRVRLWEPDWKEEPVDFLAAVSAEFRQTGLVATARRALASIEGGDPVLFIGVSGFQASMWDETTRSVPLDALGRALGRVQVPWPVNLVLLDVAQDPVGDWMVEKVRPFFQ